MNRNQTLLGPQETVIPLSHIENSFTEMNGSASGDLTISKRGNPSALGLQDQSFFSILYLGRKKD